MEPKLEMENVFLVDCHDLDKFAAIHLEGYGASWRALDTGFDGYHNGSMVSAEVKFGDPVEDEFEDQDFSRWLLGGDYHGEESYMPGGIPGIQEMMQWLCNLGAIPSGKYVVELWW